MGECVALGYNMKLTWSGLNLTINREFETHNRAKLRGNIEHCLYNIVAIFADLACHSIVSYCLQEIGKRGPRVM